jgi:hypothetical protein
MQIFAKFIDFEKVRYVPAILRLVQPLAVGVSLSAVAHLIARRSKPDERRSKE